MDALLIALPAVAARVIERCANVLGMMICAVFVWFSLKLIMDSARLGSMVVKTLSIPEWWQYALMPVCFTLLAIEFALRLRA
jgi:C4-dicarboxylate transporter, DctQ subunit